MRKADGMECPYLEDEGRPPIYIKKVKQNCVSNGKI
jgi:hypothetical protein